jgi:hypothetical protein
MPPRMIVPPRFVSEKPGRKEFNPIVAAMLRNITPGIKAHQWSWFVIYTYKKNTPAIPATTVQKRAPPLKIPNVSSNNNAPPTTSKIPHNKREDSNFIILSSWLFLA